MGLKILVLHEVSYKHKVVYEYQDFAERFAARGHEVRVIDFDDSSDGKGYCEKISRTGIGTVELESLPFVKMPLVNYLTARANFSRRLEELLRAKAVDVIFLYSVAINGTEAVRLAKKYGVPVVYRILDVYHKLRQDPWIRWPLYWGEKYIYRNCDVVCLTNEKMRGYIRDMAGEEAARKAVVVQHGVDTEYFRENPAQRDWILAQTKWPADAKILLFLGTTYTFSGLRQIVAEWPAIVAKNPRLKLLVVGPGDLNADLERWGTEKGIQDSFASLGSKPYDDVPRYIAGSDLTLLPFELNDITRDIIPIKILQYLACSKPLLASPLPDVVRLFPNEESGVVYSDIADDKQFCRDMVALANDDARLGDLGRKGRAFIEKFFSINAQMDKLEALVKAPRGR